MFGFGKKKKDVEEQAPASTIAGLEDVTQAEEAAEPVAEKADEKPAGGTAEIEQVPEFSRENGPWDVSEKKTSEGYIDLGGMLIKTNPGLNLRLEADQKSQQVIAATMQLGNGTLQVQAFAAPKSTGIWDDIRKEISESVRRQGGQVDVNDGPLGRQLISRVPTQTPDGRQGYRIARFVGVDGPRWFIRGVFSGDAVLPGDSATAMEEIFRSVVVNRGSDPMAPRDLLPMKVPQNIQDAAAAQRAAQEEAARAAAKPTVEVPRRGPEITEIG